jgi:hypothetical protein
VAQSEKIDDLPPKVLRYFPQRKSVADAVSECPSRLSKDFLAGVQLISLFRDFYLLLGLQINVLY